MIAVDSSVIVAGLLSWHEFHDRASRALGKAMAGGILLIPLPALVESYSVMTRLPAPYRLAPEIAHRLLHDSFGEGRIVALSPRKAWAFLGECVAGATVGGGVYDAVIAHAALEGRAQELLTFNPRHFETFADRIAIVVP
ncbi:MAG: PIN domain-containing protein [Acidobacteriota bacterium]|nr:PIN domain-containing protein [Acidobacteriota bacterium]